MSAPSAPSRRTPRKACKFPDNCTAAARGSCPRCSDMSAHAERMRKLHADPEFAAANAERMRERMSTP